MATKKTPLEIAKDIEFQQVAPISNKYINKVGKAIDDIDSPVAKEAATGAALVGMVPTFIGDMGRNIVTGRKQRSNEEINELAREVAKGEGKAAGGSISSASKRADGIAQRGKTRGTMVMCGGGMAKK